MRVKVIGAGLSGCEAAWQLANLGHEVTLYEMKPLKFSPAHKSPDFSELVCSNSLRADGLSSAVGLLKEEMRRLNSLIIKCADETRVPAGGALAVDRDAFSRAVTEKIKTHKNIEIIYEEIGKIPEDEPVVVATGPLSSEQMTKELERLFSRNFYFYDAAAPIVTYESINMDRAFFADRYGKGDGDGDYINCPMTKEEYESFYKELINAEEAPLHEFEDLKVFEGCMPLEVMAKRGEKTLLFGPLKPVGLTDPRFPERRYHAVVQLRRDNSEGSLYNIVGFQTHLKFPEQKRVFSMIPGLENAEFLRYGVMHRNTFLNSPKFLSVSFRLKTHEYLYFAGQMTGVEGYVESAASGLLAGLNLSRKLKGKPELSFPKETALGALSSYISDESIESFQPMNINFGIIKPLDERVKGKQNKKEKQSERALSVLGEFMAENGL